MTDFLILANGNATTYKDVFPKIKTGDIKLGVTKGICGHFWLYVPEDFKVNDASVKVKNGRRMVDVSAACWLTTLENARGNKKLELSETYTPEKYNQYDNYDAIEVSRTVDIPYDYEGVMGVPFSFLDYYSPEQFEIIGLLNPKLDGKNKYKRLLIRRIDG